MDHAVDQAKDRAADLPWSCCVPHVLRRIPACMKGILTQRKQEMALSVCDLAHMEGLAEFLLENPAPSFSNKVLRVGDLV